MRTHLIGLILWALPIAVVVATQAPQAQFGIIANVEYCTGGGKPLLMDVFIPNNRKATPTAAVLWIHGGGWEHGDKSGNSGAQFLANAGFVTASLTYRLSAEAPFPAQIEDSKCAIRYLRANAAKYGIDPDRIGAAGSSAGGHLAELIATANQNAGLEGNGGWPNVSSKVQAAVSYFGPSDLTASAKLFPKETAEVIARFMGGSESEKPALYRKASPILYVSKSDPPLLLVHGESDDDVPFDQSVRMFESYRRAGLPVEFIAVENAGHDFRQIGASALSPSLETIHQRTVDFFSHYLASIPSAAERRYLYSSPFMASIGPAIAIR
jgi:acetyl esterase/lipase